MAKMKYLVIHTTDTPYDRKVTKADIEQWHLMPRKNNDGTLTYKGKTYKSVSELPSEKVAGLDIKKYTGRGWKVPGYADMITRDGEVVNIVPYNNDDVINASEITNGATGYNSNSRHVVLAGGWSKDGKIKNGKHEDGSYFLPQELYTPEQINALLEYINRQRKLVPNVIIVGHNELSQKTCPNFDVQLFLKNHNIKNFK